MARPPKKKTPNTLFAKRLLFLFDGKNILDFETKYGLSGGQIGKYIAGREPTRPNLEAIVKGTGCNANWLLTGDGEPFISKDEQSPPTEASGGIKSEFPPLPVAFHGSDAADKYMPTVREVGVKVLECQKMLADVGHWASLMPNVVQREWQAVQATWQFASELYSKLLEADKVRDCMPSGNDNTGTSA